MKQLIGNPARQFSAGCLLKFGIALAVAVFSTSLISTVAMARCANQICQANKPTVMEENIGGKTFVVSKLKINAQPEQVWHVLSDYNHATHVFPILRACQLLEDHGSTKITRQVIAPTGVMCTYDYILEVHEVAPKSMEWHRVSGDFKQVDGFWKLEPVDGGCSTMVTYASYVDGGIFMPQLLIRHQFHIDMPNALLALKNQAELNEINRIASRRADLSTQ